MTIKKRLFISNILMIIIPAFLAVLVLIAALFLFYSTALPNSGYSLLSRHELEETRNALTEIATSWLSVTTPAEKVDFAGALTQVSDQNQMALVIEQNGVIVGKFGNVQDLYQEQLIAALAMLGDSGAVSDGVIDLFGEQITVNRSAYQVRIFNPVVSLESHSIKMLAVIFGFLMVAVVLLIVCLTNRFL